MSRLTLIGGGTAILVLVAAWLLERSSASEKLFEPNAMPPEAAPLCPWRDPGTDLKQLFPGATRFEREVRILSGHRVELTKLLGWPPTGEENALHVYQVYREKTLLGMVTTRRVKGAYGAIELVLAVNPDLQVSALRLQRLREPESVERALQQPEWLNSFTGKRVAGSWTLGRDVPDVAFEARPSAEAIIAGARGSLILLVTASGSPTRTHD